MLGSPDSTDLQLPERGCHIAPSSCPPQEPPVCDRGRVEITVWSPQREGPSQLP